MRLPVSGESRRGEWKPCGRDRLGGYRSGGWEADKSPELKSFSDIIIYEMHHRDFSIAANSGVTHKGKFLALAENGTKGPGGVATGVDHLKELGVTHVHILPSYDYGSVDETRLQDNVYNWGYDPKNYNAPEGAIPPILTIPRLVFVSSRRWCGGCTGMVSV